MTWAVRSVAVIAAAALVGGTLALSMSLGSTTATQTASATLASAPQVVQPTAASMVSLRSATSSGSVYGTGLVVEHGAVIATTLPISPGAVVTVTTEDRRTLAASVLGQDARTGLTLLAPSATLPSPTAAPTVATVGTLATVVAVTSNTGTPLIRWASATVRSHDAPMVVGNVALGTFRVGSTLDSVPGSGLIADDGTLLGIAAPNLGTHVYLPATFVELLATMMMASPSPTHGCLKIEGRTSATGGVIVVGVDAGGPAAGTLEAGDVIISVGSTSVRTISELVDTLYTLPAASRVDLVVTRHGATSRVAVKLAPST